MQFDLSEYRGTYDAMHCDTEEKANYFLEFLYDHGHAWSIVPREDISAHNCYSVYYHNTCYAFNDYTYCDTDWFIKNGHVVLEFDDFEWPGFHSIDDNINTGSLDEFMLII